MAHHYQAHKAWSEYRANSKYRDCAEKDFACGWKQGYYETACGGQGSPPPVPPTKYWKPYFQTPSGHLQVDAWYRGYQYGSIAADQAGVRDLAHIPTAPGHALPPPGFWQPDPLVVPPQGETMPTPEGQTSRGVPTAIAGQTTEPTPAVPRDGAQRPTLAMPAVPSPIVATPAAPGPTVANPVPAAPAAASAIARQATEPTPGVPRDNVQRPTLAMPAVPSPIVATPAVPASAAANPVPGTPTLARPRDGAAPQLTRQPVQSQQSAPEPESRMASVAPTETALERPIVPLYHDRSQMTESSATKPQPAPVKLSRGAGDAARQTVPMAAARPEALTTLPARPNRRLLRKAAGGEDQPRLAIVHTPSRRELSRLTPPAVASRAEQPVETEEVPRIVLRVDSGLSTFKAAERVPPTRELRDVYPTPAVASRVAPRRVDKPESHAKPTHVQAPASRARWCADLP